MEKTEETVTKLADWPLRDPPADLTPVAFNL